ncbi:hypothetical protein LO762_29640 [Actinocorallia sp. API 0066]|uniref:hypothetical protein n=1 Tax=Actinocorallia sp. API 0066 TaxID=2896846 RepID=UPI001E5F634B|nr:hypothetical protein [Actinocorallia sp. API 0066]MCD0453313.1 hypothetical protein [Actinocorallia sp. API 0066]
MADDLTFLAFRRPVLPPGDYTIGVTQAVADVAPSTRVGAGVSFATSRTFRVAGERFALPPGMIRSVFPPDGGLGEHSDTLPHVVLDRPTLPWERAGTAPSATAPPWLALLVFDGDERPEQRTVTLADLPATPLEAGQHAGDPVHVIDVPRTLLASILPSTSDLALLAHVRKADDETAVVVANRLPRPGAATTVHLVSVEGRYDATGFVFPPAEAGPLVRLVTLASWRFASVSADHTFTALAAALVDRGASFRLPDSGIPAADTFLAQGHVPVRHTLRQGGRTASWYRGPLVTGPASDDAPLGVRTADELLRHDPSTGMLDVSYAAAWQLGRLLALQNRTIARSLAAWQHRRTLAAARESEPDDHPLPLAPINTALPADAAAFLTGLAQLTGVPTRYLIPDDRLLPPESIRFVQLDPRWLAHLLDGATSIARITRADALRDRELPLPVPETAVTGALIRSDLIPAYPALQIAGRTDTAPVTPLRTTLLTPTTLLVLFPGSLTELTLSQPAQAQHFALDLTGTTYSRTLRATGTALPPQPVPPSRVLSVTALAAAIGTALNVPAATVTSASLAHHLLETTHQLTYLST